MSATDLVGGGRVRALARRLVVTGTLELTSAAQVGGVGGGTADLSLLRDRASGAPLLTGTSLAGALRSHLADVRGGYRSPREHADVIELFGSDRGDDQGEQSPLIVFDGLGTPPATGPVSEIRDGVAIAPATGTAQPGALFDLELLAPGTEFPIRVDLLLSPDHVIGGRAARLAESLAAALDGLSDRDIRLGARRSRGLGSCRARGWRCETFDLTSAEGWRVWLDFEHELPPREGGTERAADALGVRRISDDRRRRTVIDLELQLASPLLVRAAGAGRDDADAVHLRSGGRPLRPGTGLAGALRNRALRIAELMRPGEGEAMVARLFGPRPAAGEETMLAQSRLWVDEQAIVDGSAERKTNRVRIDRFTGGTFGGALFDEQPHAGGSTRARLELREPERGETGLVLLVARDLIDGDLPLGGTVAVGRGVLGGSGSVRLPDGETIPLDASAEHERSRLEAAVRELTAGATRESPA